MKLFLKFLIVIIVIFVIEFFVKMFVFDFQIASIPTIMFPFQQNLVQWFPMTFYTDVLSEF